MWILKLSIFVHLISFLFLERGVVWSVGRRGRGVHFIVGVGSFFTLLLSQQQGCVPRRSSGFHLRWKHLVCINQSDTARGRRMPQGAVRPSLSGRLLALYCPDAGHFHGQFSGLFDGRKVKLQKCKRDRKKSFISGILRTSFSNSFLLHPNVYPHFYQFPWKKETTSILLNLEKRLDAQCAKIVPER